jgi:hypothetical protein
MCRRNHRVWRTRVLRAGLGVSALCGCTLLVTMSDTAFQFKMDVGPYPEPDKYRLYPPYSLIYNLILPFLLCLGLPSFLFPH